MEGWRWRNGLGSRAMTFGAGGARSRRIERDEAADASRFFARIAYAVLGLGAPVGVVIHPLALFVIFPIGVALILMSAILEGPAGLIDRVLRAFRIPAFVALVAGLGWAMLSVLWTPYPVSAAQHALKLALLIAATLLAVAAPRDNARATDLYLFPIGVVFGMATMATMGLAHILTGAVIRPVSPPAQSPSPSCCFLRSEELTARGRNGYARLLLILALVFAYIDGYAPLTVALFAGYLALSFAISDMRRTARELAWGAAAVVLLSPLIPAIAPTVSAWIFHAKLASLPPPYAPLSVAADIFTHHKLRLITGHGFETVSRGVRAAILASADPDGPRLHGLVRARRHRRAGCGDRPLVRLPGYRQRAGSPCPLHGRGSDGGRRVGLSQCRLQRHDRDDADCGCGHCHRCGGAQPVSNHETLGRNSRQSLTGGRNGCPRQPAAMSMSKR